MHLEFIPIQIFRETPQVTFFDAGVRGSNGCDVVMHRGSATSPPNDEEFEQYYVHQFQVDHNLVIEGKRTFTLLNPSWDEPHHVIFLRREMGALQIPIGTYHRSVSGKEGSIVINQSIRKQGFDPKKEFIPVSLRERKDLREAKATEAIFWVYENKRIKRIELSPLQLEGSQQF